MTTMNEQTIELLCSSTKLERDKGILELQRNISDLPHEEIRQVEETIIGLLSNADAKWETRHGALMGCKVIIQSTRASPPFVIDGRNLALKLLADDAFQVQMASAELMGALCKVNGCQIYEYSKDIILGEISSNLERQPSIADTEDDMRHDEMSEYTSEHIKTNTQLNSTENTFLETNEWKHLKALLKCLQYIIHACSYRFNPYINQELLDLIFKALRHTNRFVRETGFYVCSVIVSCGVNADGENPVYLVEDNAILLYGDQLAFHIGEGLSDNWIQVRQAASVAVRHFFLCLPSIEARSNFFPVLIPPMCLNRYYAVERVRLYSQESWRLITDGKGRMIVGKHIVHIVRHYIEQIDADNHFAREASCVCIAEIVCKIDKSIIEPHASILLTALLTCFQDDSWPVRDAACLACENFIEYFPIISGKQMNTLLPLFFSNLQDCIPSVRHGAASTLRSVMNVYGVEIKKVGFNVIKEGLIGIEKQPGNAKTCSHLIEATGEFTKEVRDNDMSSQTDKQMNSCGSLAPKIGPVIGDYVYHKFRKPSEPWELADGCVHLIAELSSLPEITDYITQFLPLVAKAASYHHYAQHVCLLETICKKLPVIASGIGKRLFKLQLESFFDCIFYALASDNPLASTAASQCLNRLSSFMGVNIFRARIENYKPEYLEMLDANRYQNNADKTQEDRSNQHR